ncbi:hypothetical protein [Alteromonas sp. RKMC-009]|uniref:hypothetical protein n=1 Tax=Alteromonas sp. RKMC-009 TaxID=2267264 RepID=UPI000E68AD63|nr:hypothetical protein [Alteromonas sp. RKMC-009]AYA65823.1 hypothetical protein DS731_18370 [Alteromonas sp. RKMC-009]
MEVEDLSTLSQITLKWLDLILNRRKVRAEKESDAIKALMNSVSLTSRYMKSVLDDPASQSDEKEHELSDLWNETAIKVRPYKAELAQRCFFKGLYWSDTKRFSEDELQQRKLKLTDIESEISSAIKSI